MADMLPMPLNQTSTKAALSAYLGKTFQVGGRSYRLVYNAATMVAPKQKAITYTIITGGTAPVWSACKVQSAAAGQTRVAGVSVMTATGNITAGSYFYVQRSGDALEVSDARTPGLAGLDVPEGDPRKTGLPCHLLLGEAFAGPKSSDVRSEWRLISHNHVLS